MRIKDAPWIGLHKDDWDDIFRRLDEDFVSVEQEEEEEKEEEDEYEFI